MGTAAAAPGAPSGSTAATAAGPGGTGGAWSFLGPRPIAGSFNGSSGRVTALAVDPTNPSIVYAGAAGGGVWKTTDSGASWSPLTDSQPSLAIGALAVDPNNHQTVFAGTGEANESIDSQAGAGVLKSTDGGNSWTRYGAAQLGGHHIYAIAVDRTDSSHVLVASSIGLYVSTDGGQTYALNSSLFGLSPNTTTYLPRIDALVQDPDTAHSSRWYAAVDERCQASGFIGVSSDGGGTWTESVRVSTLPGLPDISRFGMAEGPGGVIYVLLAACADSTASYVDGQLAALLKSTDFASTWTVNKTMPDLFSSNGDHQGWYDNTVGVDPTNANRAVFGGITMLTTTDGGTTFTDIAKPYAGGAVHADFHAIAFTAANAFYTGNDGGVWKTTDLGGSGATSDWTNLNATLGITTFYSGSALDATHVIAGSQDDGTSGLVPGGPAPPAWNMLADGDGGDTTMIGGGTTFYGEQTYGAMFRGDYTKPNILTPAGPCSTSNTDPACAEVSAYITPFVIDPANPSIIFTAGTHLYRSTTGGVPAGSSGWTQISGDLTTGTSIFSTGDDVSAMAISNDGSVLALGTEAGKLWFVANPATNPTFRDVTGSAPSYQSQLDTGRPWITGISLPNCHGLPCVAEVSLGIFSPGRVWQVSSQGGTATNITNNLDLLIPNTAVNSILETNDGSTAGVYIGTDSGVYACFVCNNGSQSWIAVGDGLPNAQVDDVTVSADGKDVIALTHGRGAWILPRAAAQSVSTTTIDFGSATVGEGSVSGQATMTNTGLLTTQITSAVLSGPNASDFSVLSQWNCTFSNVTSGPLPIPMWPGSTCQLNVTFKPSTSGAENATLTVGSSNVPAFTVTLTGTGITPLVALSPTNMTYPTTAVGETNVLGPGRITLTNNGPGNLDVHGYQITGPDAADFSYTDDTCSGGSIKSGQSCYVDVPFKPMGPGIRTATLSILDNAPDAPQTVPLSGDAVQPAISLPAGISFGSQNVGTTGAPLGVTITNNGPGDFVMTASGFAFYGFSISGPNAADFTANIGNCYNAVRAGQSCTMTVQFAPQPGTSATRTATLNLTDNATGSPQPVALTGEAESPPASLAPASVSFGDQPVGTTSAPQLVTITNSGIAALPVAGAFSVSPAPPFAIVPGGTCTSAPLAIGASCTVAVEFSPTATGEYSGTFTLAGPGGADVVIALTGTGTAPAIQAPSSSQFGNVAWSQQASQTVTVSNDGTADLVLGRLSITGPNAPDFTIAAGKDLCSGRDVPAGGSCAVTVVFSPGTFTFPATAEQAVLEIPDNVPGQATTDVSLTGTGVTPAITVSASAPVFDAVPIGSPTSITLTVSNNVGGASGTAPLSVSGITIGGANPADFTVTSQTCTAAAVAPGAACTITVTFTPVAAGTRSARLNVTSNAYPSCCQAYADLSGLGISVAGTSCRSVAISAGVASPQPVGAQVTLNATSANTCPDPGPLYRFWLRDPSGTWKIVQDWSTRTSFAWDTGAYAPGTYLTGVWVKDAASSSTYDTYAFGTFTIQQPACTSVQVTSDLASPQNVGAGVHFTAAASGCPVPQYQWWVRDTTGTWTVAVPFAAGTGSFSWSTSELSEGTYQIGVWAREAHSSSAYDAFAFVTYTVTVAGGHCSVPRLSPSAASPQKAGTSITFTATARGCTNPLYQFWVRDLTGTWHSVQPFGSTATYTWTGSSAVPVTTAGTYLVGVWVKGTGSASIYDDFFFLTYTLTPAAGPPCTVSLAAALASGQPVGTSVTWTATSSGACQAGASYRFWIDPPGGTWTVSQEYSPAATFAWTPATAGTYQVGVWIRQPGSTASEDGFALTTFTVLPSLASQQCTSVGLTTAPASPRQVATGAIAFTATAAGCPAPQYRWWVRDLNSNWSVAVDYTTANTFNWSTTRPAGTYLVGVWARGSSSSAAYEAYSFVTFTLTNPPSQACSSVNLGPNVTSPQAPGTTVVVTAAAGGCTNAQFEFFAAAPNGAFRVIQPWSGNSRLTWNTATLPPGPWQIGVWVRQDGSTATYESFAIVTFQLLQA